MSIAVEELPISVRYVKNGAGGCWWTAAKTDAQVHAGWSNIPDDMLLAGDLAAIEEAVRSEFGSNQGAATRDFNALRALVQRPSRHVWVTIEDGFLWWATVRDGVQINHENTGDRGHFWLTLDRTWSNRSLAGRYLAVADLPGIVTAVAGFRGTVCEPQGWREILRLIRDEDDEDAAAANAARKVYESAVARLIARLGPKDFELLIDLILSRAGWTRIARLGGATEGIDVEVENVAIGEVAFVQVKAAAGQSVLDEYVARFSARRERYARMIFAVHTPAGQLKGPRELPVQVWDRTRVSELVVRLGLGDWVASRV